MMTNQFPKIWLLSVKIINFKEILLLFLSLRLSRINEVRLQNLYPSICKHLKSLIRGIIQDNTIFRRPVWNYIMKINKVKHDKCD